MFNAGASKDAKKRRVFGKPTKIVPTGFLV